MFSPLNLPKNIVLKISSEEKKSRSRLEVTIYALYQIFHTNNANIQNTETSRQFHTQF